MSERVIAVAGVDITSEHLVALGVVASGLAFSFAAVRVRLNVTTVEDALAWSLRLYELRTAGLLTFDPHSSPSIRATASGRQFARAMSVRPRSSEIDH